MFDSLVSFSYDVLSNTGSTLRDALAVSLVFTPVCLFGIFLLRIICDFVRALWRWICDHS